MCGSSRSTVHTIFPLLFNCNNFFCFAGHNRKFGESYWYTSSEVCGWNVEACVWPLWTPHPVGRDNTTVNSNKKKLLIVFGVVILWKKREVKLALTTENVTKLVSNDHHNIPLWCADSSSLQEAVFLTILLTKVTPLFLSFFYGRCHWLELPLMCNLGSLFPHPVHIKCKIEKYWRVIQVVLWQEWK